MTCQSCEVLMIQGVRCHETGCPDAWKDQLRECVWCGRDFKPEEHYQICCGENCLINYYQ